MTVLMWPAKTQCSPCMTLLLSQYLRKHSFRQLLLLYATMLPGMYGVVVGWLWGDGTAMGALASCHELSLSYPGYSPYRLNLLIPFGELQFLEALSSGEFGEVCLLSTVLRHSRICVRVGL